MSTAISRRAVISVMLPLALALAPFPARAGDKAGNPSKAFRAAMKVANPEEQIVLLAEFAKMKHKGAAKEIAKFLSNRDPDVRRAAIESLGTLGDPKSLARLIPLLKVHKDDPATLAVVARAMGHLGGPRAIAELSALSRRWLPKDARVAGAAAEALGSIPEKKSVDQLIRLLVQASPRLPSNSDKDISIGTYRTLRKSEPMIIRALAKLTGWDYKDSDTWHRFWKIEKDRWKPIGESDDRLAQKLWRDPGYGFELRRPTDAWHFDRSRPGKDDRIYAVRRVKHLSTAAVWVYAYRDRFELSPVQKAKDSLEVLELRMRDVREDSIAKIRIGKAPAARLTLTAIPRTGGAVELDERYVLRDGIMFVIGSWRMSGRSEDEAEVRSVLDSFRLID